MGGPNSVPEIVGYILALTHLKYLDNPPAPDSRTDMSFPDIVASDPSRIQ